jgi:hypothetical protein
MKMPKPKLTREEKKLQKEHDFAEQLFYPDVFGKCSEIIDFPDPNLNGISRFHGEATGIGKIMRNGKEGIGLIIHSSEATPLERIILAQGYLLTALVEDMADLHRFLGVSLKNDYAKELNKSFNKKVEEYLSKKIAPKTTPENTPKKDS